MKRYLSIILFLVINLCCSACVPRTINTEVAIPNQGAPSEQAHENQPDLENEDEQSLSKTKDEDNGNSSPENSKEIPHPRFVKIEVGAIEIGIDYIHGVFALDSNGNLYFAAEDGNLELIETNAKDFSNGSFLYLLKENGDVLKSQRMDYQKSQPLSLFYHDDRAQKISDSILTLSNGSLLSYHFDNDCWNLIDINASYVDGDYWGAGIIDQNRTLWYFNRQTGEIRQIAEDVIDCSYSGHNELYYSTDIWYITSDHTIHLEKTQALVDSFPSFPKDAEMIAGSMGRYLTKNQEGKVIWGSLWNTPNHTNILGQDIDISGTHCAILDEDGNIHFGEIQQDDCFREIQVISHPNRADSSESKFDAYHDSSQ